MGKSTSETHLKHTRYREKIYIHLSFTNECFAEVSSISPKTCNKDEYKNYYGTVQNSTANKSKSDFSSICLGMFTGIWMPDLRETLLIFILKDKKFYYHLGNKISINLVIIQPIYLVETQHCLSAIHSSDELLTARRMRFTLLCNIHLRPFLCTRC